MLPRARRVHQTVLTAGAILGFREMVSNVSAATGVSAVATTSRHYAITCKPVMGMADAMAKAAAATAGIPSQGLLVESVSWGESENHVQRNATKKLATFWEGVWRMDLANAMNPLPVTHAPSARLEASATLVRNRAARRSSAIRGADAWA